MARKRTEAQKEARKAKYAVERAQRDAKARREGMSGYQEKDQRRRNYNARRAGFADYKTKKKVERLQLESPAEYLARTLTRQLEEGSGLPSLDDLPMFDEHEFWQFFRTQYKKGTPG